MRCPNCNRYNVDDALYCRVCGERLDECQENSNRFRSYLRRKEGKIIPGWVQICLMIVFAIVALTVSYLISDSFGWLYEKVGYGSYAHEKLSKGGLMLMLLLAYGLWWALNLACLYITESLGYEAE